VFSLPLSWPYVYTSVPKLYTDDYDDAIVYDKIVNGILYNATVLDVVPQILPNVSLVVVYSSVAVVCSYFRKNKSR